MELKTAIQRATQHLLKSKKARTFKTAPDGLGEQKSFVFEMVQEPGKDYLRVTTWPHTFSLVFIPADRVSLTQQKIYAQMTKCDNPHNPINQIALRYYLDILHRESNH